MTDNTGGMMAFYTDLFSPETYEAFNRSDRKVSGFRESQHKMADRVKAGDILICYLTRMSRWIGYLEVVDGPFIDKTPRFLKDDDPFVVPFHVEQKIWLPRDHTIPIQEPSIFDRLSFTRDHVADSGWIGPLRRSLQVIKDSDAKIIIDALDGQARTPKSYPVDEDVWRRFIPATVSRGDGVVAVTVPESEPAGEEVAEAGPRPSHVIQAKLAEIGERMGFGIWIPKGDRAAVLEQWKPRNGLLDVLPLNYNETTIQTIERIDVLWLKRRAIARAFEVEHTTAIYSGILRMADLLALQPNIDIRLHIVAPEERKQKVFDEIRRPVFSLLDRAPLAESCTFLSYDSIDEIAELPHLQHLSDSVLEEYAEQAE